ncbi:MFS transporter [Paraburkholderia tagetis]|uniref:MFS transporter n=1 Tax=Paraburkholderia tagetis TaxID=2913261 RepID=A0A9X1RX41_9BURK|nr:MFS transporter [Paraburkholderia tagetis]MCG5076774.1 MFS transporter [Paraburkholderia tagetis]
MQPDTSGPQRLAIPRTIRMLGFVSLFMDLSSELIHALLPIFLVTTMGMSVSALGVLEGTAEASAMIVRIFSGPISDWLGKRKVLLLLGYGLAALSKPLFPLAGTPLMVATARIIDRVGKGIRGAPRDALIADIAPPEIRGACYGLRQSMDTVGAFAGPLAAIVLMFWFSDHIRTVLWFAVVPAFVAVGLIVFGVEEPAREGALHAFRSPLHWRALQAFSGRYWFVVVLGAAFTLTRFSEAFLVLRAQQTGLNIAWIPGVMVVMSLTYALSAYPVGMLSDRVDRRVLLGWGIVLLIVADMVLGMGSSIFTVLGGVALWGLHMGFTQGILAAMVAETAPQTLRGSAFGVFNLVSGVCLLFASVIAGWLWDRYGAAATFFAGAGVAVVPLVMCCFAPRLVRRRH